jgi:1,2-phenylacetyl-CoA epoxidase PaaB subunit
MEPSLAWHAAKEIYTRREQCTVLWIARRSGMVFSTAGDRTALSSARRLDYRTPGFPGRHRRDRERAVAGSRPESPAVGSEGASA